ncbi:WD repeat-containing protein 19 [Caerostris extrusa]|uniref:WD repeat-containing protein 19 n=1 Tax=Caerostris extrusa TaxID=172846 RepID=A0AAV4RU02_CAEEX|nr:WD repeat-containing protein 19 [Caerostris extrusa]
MIHLFLCWSGNSVYPPSIHRTTGIKDLHPDFSGTRILIIDSKGAAFVCNPLDSSLLAVPNFSSNVTHLLWNHSTVYKEYLLPLMMLKLIYSFIFVIVLKAAK